VRSPEPVDVIIPTMDNLDQLSACLYSLHSASIEYPLNFIIVNNGQIPLQEYIPAVMKNVTVIGNGQNNGWVGGLQMGLEHSKSKYVIFSNDDIYVPRSSRRIVRYLLKAMDTYPIIGAIGPTSNVVMGSQNIWVDSRVTYASVPFLIGFFIMLRREALDKVGGVQSAEYGGDDIDLSIRLRDAGYILAVATDQFVYHHGFQTGNRVHGGPDKPNGWNSREMTDATNNWLIQKHGFMKFWKTLVRPGPDDLKGIAPVDSEGEIIRKYVCGEKVLELGCGGQKTVPHAIGIDRVPKGCKVPNVDGISVADITGDVCDPLPFEPESVDCILARHVLEHVIDTAKTLSQWLKVLKPGGRLILACPDEALLDSIPLNPEHVHAFTPDSLKSLTDLLGCKTIATHDSGNQVSFVNVMEKN
jgi:hypothetical protein